MAFTKAKSRKCPVCVGCTPPKVKEIDEALGPLLEDVKLRGEVPKASDKRFSVIALALGISPYSLQYHLKSCLVDLQIQDQRLVELKDIASALATAKHEYHSNPTMQNSTAYKQLFDGFRAMCTDIEGQQDPEVTVEYIVEAVMAPLSRRALSSATEQLRALRETLIEIVPKNQVSFINSQIDNTLRGLASSMRVGMDEGLKNVCNYYQVELEAQARKRALENGLLLEKVEAVVAPIKKAT